MNGPIPQGIEILVKKASVDAEFRDLLLTRRTEAADQIGLKLTPAEVMMLAAVPREQLEAIIARVSVPQEHRRAFLGKAAAAMVAALAMAAGRAVAGGGDERPARVIRPDAPPILAQGVRPDPPPYPAPGGVRPNPPQTFGLQPDLPNGPPPAEGPDKKDDAEKPAAEKTEKEKKEHELEKQVIAIIAKQLHVDDPKEVTKEKSLVDDLGATGPALVRLRKTLELKFKIKVSADRFKKVRSVGDVVGIVRELVDKKSPPVKPLPTGPQTPPDQRQKVAGATADRP